jgi:hypothetical protein
MDHTIRQEWVNEIAAINERLNQSLDDRQT